MIRAQAARMRVLTFIKFIHLLNVNLAEKFGRSRTTLLLRLSILPIVPILLNS